MRTPPHARAMTNAGRGSGTDAALLLANLETRRVVGRPAAFPISAELRFGMNPGRAPTQTMRSRRRLLTA